MPQDQGCWAALSHSGLKVQPGEGGAVVKGGLEMLGAGHFHASSACLIFLFFFFLFFPYKKVSYSQGQGKKKKAACAADQR